MLSGNRLSKQVDTIVLPLGETFAAVFLVTPVRELGRTTVIAVRCRYQGSIDRVQKAGASVVISEEAEASEALLQPCEAIVELRSAASPTNTVPSKDKQ